MSLSQIKLFKENKMKFTTKQIGDFGEKYTVKYLKKNGYKLLERNYLKRYGEIDIIAENKEYIVFVEVKTRNTNAIARAGEAVNFHKRRCLIKTASAYISEHNITKFCRFDVSEVYIYSDTLKIQSINYIENAFILE